MKWTLINEWHDAVNNKIAASWCVKWLVIWSISKRRIRDFFNWRIIERYRWQIQFEPLLNHSAAEHRKHFKERNTLSLSMPLCVTVVLNCNCQFIWTLKRICDVSMTATCLSRSLYSVVWECNTDTQRDVPRVKCVMSNADSYEDRDRAGFNVPPNTL